MGRLLVTGAAGFIGYHFSLRMLERGRSVLGLDNLNDYYEVSLKQSRLDLLRRRSGELKADFRFSEFDMADRAGVEKLFAEEPIDLVVHLAAQAGVRYSIENPHVYIDSNIVGFLNLLEACKDAKVGHLIYASSSSVYGANRKLPFAVGDSVDHPVSLYAATKKSNELMAHVYSSMYAMPVTGLRFFTVYGPWGRPDMALFKFTRNILEGKPIDVYNQGKMKRDFTFIDDIVAGMEAIATGAPPAGDPDWDPAHPAPATSYAPYRLYNIGNNNSVDLERFISVLERAIGKPAIKNYMPMQAGDVEETYADVSALKDDYGVEPQVGIDEGIPRFVDWYREYYGV